MAALPHAFTYHPLPPWALQLGDFHWLPTLDMLGGSAPQVRVHACSGATATSCEEHP